MEPDVFGQRHNNHLINSFSKSDIIREQLNTAPLTIHFMEIKEILKSKKGGFMIKGRTRTDVICIPYLIDNAAALEVELGKFAPIISGMVVSAAFIFRFIELVTNKSVPTNLKRRSWPLLLVVAFAIYTMYIKLTGQGY